MQAETGSDSHPEEKVEGANSPVRTCEWEASELSYRAILHKVCVRALSDISENNQQRIYVNRGHKHLEKRYSYSSPKISRMNKLRWM